MLSESNPAPVALSVHDLTIAYDGRAVLKQVSVSFSRGAITALCGPNGSGKSTLLNLVGLLDRPTSGTLAVCGEETTTLDDRALTRLREVLAE